MSTWVFFLFFGSSRPGLVDRCSPGKRQHLDSRGIRQLGDGHVSCHECHQSISIQWLSVPCTTTISAQCCSRFYEFLVMMENSFDSWHRWIWHSHQNHQNPTTSVVNGFCILSCRPWPSLCHLPALRGAAFGHREADSTLGEARVERIPPRGILIEEYLFFVIPERVKEISRIQHKHLFCIDVNYTIEIRDVYHVVFIELQSFKGTCAGTFAKETLPTSLQGLPLPVAHWAARSHPWSNGAVDGGYTTFWQTFFCWDGRLLIFSWSLPCVSGPQRLPRTFRWYFSR